MTRVISSRRRSTSSRPAVSRLPQQSLCQIKSVRAPQPDLTELLTVADDEPFILHPGEFVLGQTLEWVELPDDLVSRLKREGFWAASDCSIHSTAGYGIGLEGGVVTLQLSNVANLPIALYFGCGSGDQLLPDVRAPWTGRMARRRAWGARNPGVSPEPDRRGRSTATSKPGVNGEPRASTAPWR